MNPALVAAAVLALAIGLAHSVLGERYILIRLFRRDLPKLHGSPWFTRQTLRFAWHLTTIAWWGFAIQLGFLARADTSADGGRVTLIVIAIVFGLSGLVTLVFSRGKHFAWIVFLAIAALIGTHIL